MMVAMALVVKDQLYYRELEENGSLCVGSEKNCDVLIPALDKKISVVWKTDHAELIIDENSEKAKKKFEKPAEPTTLTANNGEITVVDAAERIFAAFAYVTKTAERVYFDNNCVLGVGRNGGKTKDGKENAILVQLPFVSSWHMDLIYQNGKLYVKNKSKTNGTFVNGEQVSEKEVRPGDVISVLTFRMLYDGNSLSFFNAGDAVTVRSQEKSLSEEKKQELIIFERSVRLKNVVEAETIAIPSPPAIGAKPEIDKLNTFLPAIISVCVGVVMFIFLGNVFSLIYSLPMTLSGVFMSMANYKKQMKGYDTDCQKAVEEFETKSREAEEKLKRFNAGQISVMNAENPETPRLINAAKMRNNILWNRQASDDDFLTVRLGVGKAATKAEIRMDINGNADGSDYAKKCCDLKEKYAYINDAPICCDLRQGHITGIVGKPANTTELIRNIMIQMAACRCYTDLRIVFLDSNPDMAWTSKLPHVNGLYATNREDADEVLRNVISILQDREKAMSSRNTYGKAPVFLPHMLFVIADPALLSKNYNVQKYIIEGERLGVSVIMAVEEMNQLPINSNAVIRLDRDQGELFFQSTASQKTKFAVEKVANSDAMRFSEALENVRVREESNADTGSMIPTKYTFFDMLGIKSAKELDLKKRWEESDICREIKAPMGMGSSGLVELDISGGDNADGPHGLVAGTTGSGKSETLASYLLALTTRYSPIDLSMVIIDFKGGAMCNKFRGIPHLVGTITDLADKEIERSIKTLDAEIKHRKQLLQDASDLVAAHDIDNVNKYAKLFKAGKVKEPMPHLLIVVDEFAQLKMHYPEFLKKLVSVAQIGRSLGVHLILATQKPAGQVSDQIWSNSKFRICLKVQTEQDSKEVIKSDLAAKIKEAGRAYLMVGNNERFELLQSGYSGVPDVTASSDGSVSQFNATVNHIAEFCRREKVQKMPALFMEQLPVEIEYRPFGQTGDAAGTVAIGHYDDPERKLQDTHTVSLVNSNLMVLGSSQMGKTNLLQSVIRSLAEQYTPSEVSIYILDFASQLLRKYAALNHVGGVVTSSDDEKLKHLMQLLDHEFAVRREKFSNAGVTSLAAYRELGKTDVPHIVVIIDNLTALKELYFQQEDEELVRLCKDGISVGITVVVANTHTKGLSYKYLSFFDSRIALYNTDSNEYGNLFDHCREKVDKIPGRCLISQDSRILDCQTFLAFAGNMNAEIENFVNKTQAKYGAQRAAKIPELPQTLTTADLVNQCAAVYQVPYSIAMGLDYETVAPVVRNVRRAGCLSLCGGSPEAQSVYLGSMIRQMNAAYPGKAKVWILDGLDRMLQPFADLPNVMKYSINSAAAPEIVAELEQKAKSRMAMLEFGDSDGMEDAELLVLVINNPSVADVLNTNKTALMSYNALISKYKDMGICVLVSNVPNAAFISSEFYKKSVENKQFLWFDNLPSLKIVTVPYAVSKKFSKKLTAGDVYLFNDTECSKLKTPLET